MASRLKVYTRLSNFVRGARYRVDFSVIINIYKLLFSIMLCIRSLYFGLNGRIQHPLNGLICKLMFMVTVLTLHRKCRTFN